jgi:methyltransferase (TIGR00027 family)
MQEAQPSRTAMRVAMRRAAHQLFDVPPVLNDPLALAIVGEEAAAQLRAESRTHGGRIASTIRAFMAVRSRLAEDELARAVSRGVSQYVILGAGLDTFAYRNPHPVSALRVFEVDFAATQAWKRRKLAAAAIPLPASLSFVSVDFESESLAERLAGAGLDRQQPTFFTWLGVTMYLTDAAIASTLEFIASTPAGSSTAEPTACAYEAGWAESSVQRWLDTEAEPSTLSSTSEPHRSYNVELRSTATASK